MTSQTKTFIELSDILGLRLQCKACGCALLLNTEVDGGAIENVLSANNTVLAKCPTCGEIWAQNSRQSAAWDSDIKDFVRKIRDLRKIEPAFGCVFSLEIRDMS
jgi:hypothetical protein